MERNAQSKKKAKNEVLDDDPEDDDPEDVPDDDNTKKTTASSPVASARRGGNLSPPCCQAELCTADLAEAKRYHRRHKVCEHHFKAPIVMVAGLRQRFCQQCSRFHQLSEFDEAKRSCRRRLAGHNERRRKNSSSESHAEGSSRKGVDPQLKENHCRQADQNGRMPANLPGNATYKHFQIR